MSGDLKLLLVLLIVFLVVVILTIIMVTVVRRTVALRRYRILDKRRKEFDGKIRGMLDRGEKPEAFSIFSFPHRSLEWQAVESVLFSLLEDKKYEAHAPVLFDRLGYRVYYEKMLTRRNVIEKSSAADKLGRMHCEASVGKLVLLLEEENPEVASVTMRALSKIGSTAALKAVLYQVPGLYSRLLVTRKSIAQALLNFGPKAVPEMVQAGERYGDPVAKAFILQVLKELKSVEALPFAFKCLKHSAPEVRSKALTMIASAGGDLSPEEKDKILPLLDDPVWFVRLQAARTVGLLRHCPTPSLLEKRMLDEKWQVRNAAVAAVIMAASDPVEVFLETLSSKDRYAKESICEEIQKTGFVYQLIENLDPPGTPSCEKSLKVLGIMASLGYGTPVLEYMKNNPDSVIARELATIMPADRKGAVR